jgi:hypothetical protein
VALISQGSRTDRPTEVPAFNFVETDVGGEKEAPISDQPAPVDVIIGNTPIIPFTHPQRK